MTTLCVPTEGPGGLDAQVGEHFGRVPTYTLFDTATEAVRVVDNTSEHTGGRGLPADILSGLGIDVLLCRGLGRRAIGLLEQHGIDVCAGVTGTAREAIGAWKAGRLSTASEADACERHAFHDSKGHHGHR